jgi:RNA polymerase sigma-70 factor (ECF subfamily)
MKMESLDEPPEGQGPVSPALLRDWREIPSEVLERQEFRLLLQQAITDLPLIYREIFLLRDVEELSVDESAEVLGITVASVKVRLHRARIMLQKKLVPQLKKAIQNGGGSHGHRVQTRLEPYLRLSRWSSRSRDP